MDAKVALITGSNRGLGVETARQLAKKGVTVVMTARNQEEGKAAQAELQAEGLPVDFQQLDVTDEVSIKSAYTSVEKKYGKLDILINNAAIYPDADKNSSGLDVPVETVSKVLDANTLGPLRMIQAFVPLMKKTTNGMIINITSGLGQFKNLASKSLAYRMSKTGLNALTKIMADELKSFGIRVNALCPLWVRTDMGGEKGKRSPEEAAAHIVTMALDEDPAKTGQFQREGKAVDW